MAVQDIVFLKLEKEKIINYLEIKVDDLSNTLNNIITL